MHRLQDYNAFSNKDERVEEREERGSFLLHAERPHSSSHRQARWAD